MLYTEFMKKAEEFILSYDEDSGLTYLEPDYVAILRGLKMDPEKDISDYPLSWAGLEDRMRLEVERRNKLDDRTKYVVDWLYSVLTAAIEPAMLQEENELMKNMMDYMNLNVALKEKEKNLAQKEEALDQKQNVVKMMPGINFSKRGSK